jgi:hypothetical protein
MSYGRTRGVGGRCGSGVQGTGLGVVAFVVRVIEGSVQFIVGITVGPRIRKRGVSARHGKGEESK